MARIVPGMRNSIRRLTDHRKPTPRRKLTKSLPGERGAVALLVGLAAPTLMMALAISVELTGWTVAQIQLQRTADVAAAAGGLAYASGASIQLSATHAAYVAEINGASGSTTRNWASATNTLTDNQITVTKIAGIKNAADVAFQVTVSQTVPRTFSRLVLQGTGQTLTATAVSEVVATTVTSQLGKYCVLALASITGTGISLSNGVSVNTAACGVEDNSLGATALSVVGGATLSATSVSVVGGYTTNNGGTMTVSGSTNTGAAAGTNPYAGVALPSPGSCSGQSTSFTGGTFNLTPGTFCNGMTVSGWSSSQTTVNMSPGVYIVDAGNFVVNNVTLNAPGVTIVLTGTSATTGTVTVQNGSVLNITAPTTGPTSGLAFMQNSNASNTSTSNFMGGSVMNITGAIDFPNSIVDFSNGTSNNASCTQLIAYQIVFQGGATFGNNCTGTGTSGIGAPSSTTYSVSLVR